jgi:hypothetical protein
MFLIKRKTIGSPGINWNGLNARRQTHLLSVMSISPEQEPVSLKRTARKPLRNYSPDLFRNELLINPETLDQTIQASRRPMAGSFFLRP